MKTKNTILFFLMFCVPALSGAQNSIAQTQSEADIATFRTWAKTPPMGWNSWDCYYCTVNEDLVMKNAKYMKDNLLKYGWEYVIVDIRWYANHPSLGGGSYNQTNNPDCQLDEYGRYLPSPTRFPSAMKDGKNIGFKAIADSLHAMGLKFGIHIMRGMPKYVLEDSASYKLSGAEDATWSNVYAAKTSTCSWLQDNLTVQNNKYGQLYYNSLANLYASWGVDFIKVDDMSRPFYKDEIKMLRNAIDQCGRPIVLSLSPGKTALSNAQDCLDMANQWRMMDDLWDRWSDVNAVFSVASSWASYYRTGNYADCDILPLGHIDMTVADNGYCTAGSGRDSKLTKDEQYTTMTLWGICHSPLFFGGDLTMNDTFTNSLLTNEDLLHCHAYGENAHQVYDNDGQICWTSKDPDSNNRYLALFNADAGSGWIYYTKALYTSSILAYTTDGHCEDVDIKIPSGTTKLCLVTDDGGDGNSYDHGDWINPTFITSEGKEINLTSDYKIEQYTNSYYNVINENKNVYGTGKMSVLSTTYDRGFSMDANALTVFTVPDGATEFKVKFALDDTGIGQTNATTSVRFLIFDGNPRTDIENSPYKNTDTTSKFTVDLTTVGFDATQNVKFYNIWNGTDEGTFKASEFSTTVNSHGTKFYKLVPTGATGISSVNNSSTENEDNRIYNLNGQQVGKDYTGIVIKNNKKYIAK